MKYLFIDRKNSDEFIDEFNSEKEAIEAAEMNWTHLTDNEKKSREAFYVLESVNPDEDADDHLEGNIIKDFLN